MVEQRVAERVEGAGAVVGDNIFFIGTATVLISVAGFTILTDPNFLHRGEEAKLGYGLRSKRLTDPAIEIDQLPRLDLVILSHLHGDHWDDVASERLERGVPIVTTRTSATMLERKGFTDTRGLRTWGWQEFRKGDARLRVTAVPGQHGPKPLYALLPRVMGSIVEVFRGADRLLRLYISGDTLIHERLHMIPERFPQIDLGLFHLGGTRIGGVLLTMDAEQGVEAVQIVRPEVAIPIHYDDYDVFRSPIEAFRAAVAAAGLDDRVSYLARGESYQLPRVPVAG